VMATGLETAKDSEKFSPAKLFEFEEDLARSLTVDWNEFDYEPAPFKSEV